MRKIELVLAIGAAVVAFLLSSCITQSQKDLVEKAWEKVPTQPTPMPDRIWEHGRLITWYTPQGKKVEVHEDGTFIGQHWESEAEKSWEGIICAYKKKFPDSRIDETVIDGTETRVDSCITNYDPRGTFQDGTPAKVPNQIQHWIRTKWKSNNQPAPYYLEFSYGNMSDCINSLNGLYVIGGPPGHLNMVAQRRSSHPCDGKRTYLR